jgi:hypothetical protein
LLLGLLVGTILYIIGGYFLPFIVYSGFMLLVVPFAARLIPSKPLEDKNESGFSDKNSDEDAESAEDLEDHHTTSNISVDKKDETVQDSNKKKVIPLFLVWKLLVNPVS